MSILINNFITIFVFAIRILFCVFHITKEWIDRQALCTIETETDSGQAAQVKLWFVFITHLRFELRLFHFQDELERIISVPLQQDGRAFQAKTTTHTTADS